MRLVVLTVMTFGLFVATAVSGDIPADIETSLKAKNLPIYPGLTYCTGYLETGVRLASSDSAEKVRKWYQGKLPGWSVMDSYGSWVLYEGEPNASPTDVMSGKQIIIMKNNLLPSWHNLAADMTTEVMATFPN